VKRLLIIRPDGIGDFIIFSAVLEKYTEAYPGYRIDILCDRSVRSLVEPIPFIRSKFFFDNEDVPLEGVRGVGNKLYNRLLAGGLSLFCYDVVIYPVYSRSWNGIFFLSSIHAREKIAFDAAGDLEQMGEYLDAHKRGMRFITSDKGQKKELDRNVEFVSKLMGIDAGVVFPRVWFLEDDERRFRELQKEFQLEDGAYIIIFPGAKFFQRHWQGEKWADLLALMQKAYSGKKLVVVGSGRDKTVIDDILQLATERQIEILNLYGRTSLRVLAKLIGGANFVVSTETSVIHIAAAMKTPNVCIIGGGHFERFYPYGDLERNRVAFKKMDCFGCDWNCQYTESRCISAIEVEDVWAEIQRLPECYAER